jgi:hypothetical protein
MASHRNPDEWEAERGSLWATFIRRCVTIPPKLDHSRLAKLSSPRLLAAQQRLDVADKTSASRDRLGPFWGPPLQMRGPMHPVTDLLGEAERTVIPRVNARCHLYPNSGPCDGHEPVRVHFDDEMVTFGAACAP